MALNFHLVKNRVLFFPVGFKGNRFHNWNLFYIFFEGDVLANGGVNVDGFPLVSLQLMGCLTGPCASMGESSGGTNSEDSVAMISLSPNKGVWVKMKQPGDRRF